MKYQKIVLRLSASRDAVGSTSWLEEKSSIYVVVGGEELYHRSASGVLMRCISEEDGRKLLKKIHSGICGNHATSRTLVGKAFSGGLRLHTQTTSSTNVRDANILLGRYTCRCR